MEKPFRKESRLYKSGHFQPPAHRGKVGGEREERPFVFRFLPVIRFFSRFSVRVCLVRGGGRRGRPRRKERSDMTSSKDREGYVYIVKLAEQAERYDEMVDAMKKVAHLDVELTVEERNLLSVGYKNVVGSRRASWRILSSIEQKEEAKGNEVNAKRIRDYRQKVESELSSICGDAMTVIDEHLIPSSPAGEATVFYYKMKGDYYRYLAEFKAGNERKEAADQSLKAYQVSYKWLSRYFSLSSNEAKRVLKEFAELHGGELEVIYALSGWLKNKPQSYSVVLTRKDKLSGIREEFEDGSVQVYSVQASIPKDPAALVSAEYVQAEELFGQSLTNENCLRDNRYGAVSNSFVKRNADVKPPNVASVEPKTAVVSNSILKKPTESKPFSPIVPHSAVEVSKKPVKVHSGNGVQCTKSVVDSEKASSASALRKKDQNGKNSSGTGGSLTNLWGRASSKPKVGFSATDAAKDSARLISNSEAQINVQEIAEALSSDDDMKDHRRRDSTGSGGRKRRVVFDYSDEEVDEAVISLASPEPPKAHTVISSKCSNNGLTVEKKEMELDEPTSNSGLSLNDSPKGPCASKSRTSSSERVQDIFAEASNNDHIDEASGFAAVLPRRKILKTRIDDRGREVNEVVWEGETEEDNKGATDAAIIAKDIKNENNGVEKRTGNRAAAAVKKPPALTNAAPAHLPVKAGNKKTPKNNVKDVKQGSITAFFKKV